MPATSRTSTPRKRSASQARPASEDVEDIESTDVPADEGPAELEAPASAATLDEALSAWSGDAGRAWANLGFSLCAAWLQGARALREEQRAAAERAEAACVAAGEKLQSAGDWQRAAAVQADFLRAQLEDNVQTVLRLAAIARDNAAALARRAAEGLSDAQLSGFNGLSRWAQVQAALPNSVEALEAEAEHLANPLAASPLVWPAQEALRQGMGFANSMWNDWVETAQRRMH
jgi:hypothetical protein